MSHPTWSRRFFSSTRGRIVELLRRAPLTVDDLAAALGLTDNAVRAQLSALERDGLVRQHGSRKGVRKPSLAYELAPGVEATLSRAYLPLLEALVETLAASRHPAELRTLLEDAGRRAATAFAPLRGTPESKVTAASQTLNALGGLTAVEPRPEGWVIASEGCPVAALVCRHPDVCVAIEAMLSELTQLPTRERCDRNGERPKCRFEIDAPAQPVATR